MSGAVFVNTQFQFGRLSRRLMQGVCCLGLFGCVAAGPAPYERPQPRSQAEIDFAKTVLDHYQVLSIDINREYCGYIGLDGDGNFAAGPVRRGSKSGCRPKEAPQLDILASFHTHGAHMDRYESELPSSDDLEADIDEGVDGYIATPGGRLWYSDAQAEKAVLIGEAGFLVSDPAYEGFEEKPVVKPEYSLDALFALEQD